MALMEPRSPDVETVPSVDAGFPYGTFGSYGIPNRFWMEPFWGCPVIGRWGSSSIKPGTPCMRKSPSHLALRCFI
jgi:hypothetical protein